MTSEQATIYRKRSIPDRLRVALGLHEFARKHLEATLRADHPEYSERQLSDAIVRRDRLGLEEGWKDALRLAESDES
ncbi:MAG: hypothetical protein Q7V01_03835 [Vicinamibacterales bacterium]|nr:hypothetical protein [Vicinamibacterales bacterium]